MAFSASLDLMPGLGMVPTPALVAYAQLLALPGAELEQTVAGELSQNPALIQDETPTCRACGMPADPPCPYCAAGDRRTQRFPQSACRRTSVGRGTCSTCLMG